MTINEIKNPNDILTFMNDNIEYGWLDIYNNEHIKTMDNFRKLYRTSSIDEIINHKLGTCIEQVYLIHTLLNKIGILSKMYCARVYEDNSFNDLEAEEHMHCFVLYHMNNKVYQMEHSDYEKVGIYEFESEEDAIKEINEYYVKKDGGILRSITEFFDVEQGLSYKEFNEYINSLNICEKHL